MHHHRRNKVRRGQRRLDSAGLDRHEQVCACACLNSSTSSKGPSYDRYLHLSWPVGAESSLAEKAGYVSLSANWILVGTLIALGINLEART